MLGSLFYYMIFDRPQVFVNDHLILFVVLCKVLSQKEARMSSEQTISVGNDLQFIKSIVKAGIFLFAC